MLARPIAERVLKNKRKRDDYTQEKVVMKSLDGGVNKRINREMQYSGQEVERNGVAVKPH